LTAVLNGVWQAIKEYVGMINEVWQLMKQDGVQSSCL